MPIDFKKLTKKPKIEPHATIDGVEVNFDSILDGSITLEQWEKTRANSPGFEAMYPKLNNEALSVAVQHNLNNCTHLFDPSVYEYVLIHTLVPLLLKRLKEQSELIKVLVNTIEGLSK